MYGYRYRYTIYTDIVYLDCHSPSNVIYIITGKRRFFNRFNWLEERKKKQKQRKEKNGPIRKKL